MSTSAIDSFYKGEHSDQYLEPTPVSDQQPQEQAPLENEETPSETQVPNNEAQVTEQEAQTQAPVPGVEWSSFGEGIDSQEALMQRFKSANDERDQLRQEMEQLKAQNPYSHELIAQLNDYVSKAGDDPAQAIRQFMDIQARDFDKMDDDVLIKEMRKRESGLNAQQVEVLFNHDYSLETPDFGDQPDDVSEYMEWQKKKTEFANLKAIKDAKRIQEANKARRYFKDLKETTKVPEAFRLRQEQVEQQAQKKENFIKQIPNLVKDTSLNLDFGEGKEPFKFALDAEAMEQIKGILPTVPGIENMGKEELSGVIEHLAWGNPKTRARMLPVIYKHISSQSTKELHEDLGINSDVVPKGPPVQNGVSTAMNSYYGE